MPTPSDRPTPPSPHRHVVLYDGVCGLCNWAVRFTIARDPDQAFAFAALQSDVATTHLARHTRGDAPADSVIVIVDVGTADERLLERSNAALFIAGQIGWPWRALRVFVIVPRFLRDLVYRAIAATRYRIFGKSASCPRPTPEQRSRFLDFEGDLRGDRA